MLVSEYACVQHADSTFRMDARVHDKIVQLTTIGVRRLAEMRRHLRHFVNNDLFAGLAPPASSDARYWPSGKVIVNCMHRTIVSLRYYGI